MVSRGSASFDIWRCLEVCLGLLFEVSKGLGRICYHEVPRGSVSFDIMRCLEVRYHLVSGGV